MNNEIVHIIENCHKEAEKRLVGQENLIDDILTAFIAGGHVLLEGVPGLAKTLAIKTVAEILGLDFKRIQFTPDLLPSDLTGINFYNMKTQEFEFRPGPLFTQMILADEINRATPRTQASMLEAMEERQVTIDGVTYPMKEPFMVMATENPLESYGTFALPEAQIDRFFMRLQMGYMSREQEREVIARKPASVLVSELQPVVTREETEQLKKAVREIYVSDAVSSYIMDIVEQSRKGNRFGYGISTRGGIALYAAAQVHAALSGRDYVIPEDVRDLCVPVLAHRIGGSTMSMEESENRVISMLENIKVPLEEVQ